MAKGLAPPNPPLQADPRYHYGRVFSFGGNCTHRQRVKMSHATCELTRRSRSAIHLRHSAIAKSKSKRLPRKATAEGRQRVYSAGSSLVDSADCGSGVVA